MCTRQILLVEMYQFKPMKNSALIIIQALLAILLEGFYRLNVYVKKKLYSNSCCRDIHLYDAVQEMILIQFEVISQSFTSYE